jgi:outer membrane protein OmpA-like peptidoglycan-associated protein
MKFLSLNFEFKLKPTISTDNPALQIMKFLISLFVPLFLTSSILAQPFAFLEDFNDNKNGWANNNTEFSSSAIENGYYVIQHKRDKKNWNYWCKVNNFSASKDFTIETKLKMDRGNDDYHYGLIWGVKNAYNLNHFCIKPNGKFKIYQVADSNFTTIQDWTETKHINKIGVDNILKLEFKNGLLSYFINNKLVYKTNNFKILGPSVGFCIEKQAKVLVDYIKVKQNTKLNLVPDAIQGRQKISPGSGVNSSVNDIMPIVSADGNALYFVRKKHPNNYGIDKKDDVWVSTKDDNGNWSEAANMGPPINNEEHNQVLYISPDGQTIMVGNHYSANGKSSGKGISISRLTSKGWSVPEPVYIEAYINKDPQYSLSFSANRKIIILSIIGKTTYGQKDLYVSFQLDEKHYSEPINLGPNVNTYLEENTPYLAADGKTLYFSSEGHPGYGSADVFVSKRLDDSWQKWSEPMNLGPEINGKNWDAYYNIPASGDKAYMVSTSDNLSNTDIYTVEIPKAARPEPVSLIYGNVYNALNKKPLEAEISFYTGLNHKEAGLAHSDAGSGKYKVVLEMGKSYDYFALRKGYFAGSKNIDLGKIKDYKEINLDFYLYPVEKGVTIPMERVRINSDKISTETTSELNRLADLLEIYPEMQIQLQSLSKKQNDAIKKFLNERGIKTNRVSTIEKTGTEEFAFQVVSFGKELENIKKEQSGFNSQVDVSKLKSGQSFKIENLFFMADSTSFTKNSIKALDDLAFFLKEHKNIKIEIGGHTNGLPAHDYCDKLSQSRAMNVADYLKSKGLNPEQIQYKGYGKRIPIADNETEQGRRQNQRVEVKILEIK